MKLLIDENLSPALALDWVRREADGDLINRVLEVVTLEELRLHQIPPPVGSSKG